MSKVKIQGHASGSGVLTITAPNTSTDRTITLPDTTGTLLDENSSVPAANLTGTVADARISTLTASKLTGALPAISGASLTNLPAGGKVIGYQSSTHSVNRTGTAGSEVATGFTWSYTPSSATSKLFISVFMAAQTMDTSTSATRVTWRVRTGTGTGGTELQKCGYGEYENEVNVSVFEAPVTFAFTHHPNTTNAQAYNVTVQDISGTPTWKCEGSNNEGVSTVTILELAG